MGDRCWCHGYVRRTDWPRFRALTEADENPHSLLRRPGMVPFTVDEADYAMLGALEQAAAARVAFYSYNDPGDEYPSGVTVSIGDGVLLSADTDSNYKVIISLSDDGELHHPGLHQAREVCRAIRVVQLISEVAP